MNRKVLDFISDLFFRVGYIRCYTANKFGNENEKKTWKNVASVHKKTKANFIVKDIVLLENPNIYNLV